MCVHGWAAAHAKSVVIFIPCSQLDAPYVSLTLSLIIRYTASCWGKPGVGDAVTHKPPVKVPRAHVLTAHSHTHTQVVLEAGRCNIFISSSLLHGEGVRLRSGEQELKTSGSTFQLIAVRSV